MLHGIPGAGKTSTIKAIAKDTNRHIFNLSLRPYTTQRQLTNLFLNESVTIMGADGNKQTLKIPPNRRVYVIEDIDCLTNVVWDRELQSDKKESDFASEAVTLSFLLNLLDGVLETPGRILVITSNYPEKLDRALVRPGRIDVKIKFNNASRAFIHEMLEKFYSLKVDIAEVPEELEGIFTPAEVMESCCYFFKDYKKALEHLISRRVSKVSQASRLVAPTQAALQEAPEAGGTLLETLEKSSANDDRQVQNYDSEVEERIHKRMELSDNWVKNISSGDPELGETYKKMMDGPMFQSSLLEFNEDANEIIMAAP